MNQRIGLAVALALCLGVMSIQAEAAQAEAASSGETQPKKRKLAKTKAKKSSSKTKKADSKANKGKKRKLAAADKSAGKKTSASAATAAKKDAPKAAATPTAKATPEATPAKVVSASTQAATKDIAKTESPSAKVATGADNVAKSAKGQTAATPAPKPKKEAAKSAKVSPPASSASPAPAASKDKDAMSPPSGDAKTAASTSQPPAAPASPSARPWADGVSQANQQQALRIFREGNGLLKQAVFAQAADKYREALTYWDHPAIHYNLVLALLNLDRPTEVLEHLNKAMAYGAAPLDSEKFEQALQYKMLTERQLSRLVVRCDLEGAVVSMDGQELFVAPGKYEGYVRPGPHSIVAKKEGFMNSEISPSLVAGTLSEFDMVLIAAGDMTQYRRLWPNWRPWTVFGAGLAVAAVGVGLHLKGRSDVSSFDETVAGISNRLTGLNANEPAKYDVPAEYEVNDVKEKRDSGLRNQKIAMVMYGVGGAAIVTGAVLLYFNRLRPYTPETSTQVNPGAPSAAADKSPEVNILPMFAPEAPGMMATVRF